MIKKMIILIALMAGSVRGATGDISNVAVNADGKTIGLTIAGVSTGGTWDFSHTGNNNRGTNTPWLYIKRLGFDTTGAATFVYDTITIDTTLRQRTPNQTSDSVVVSGSDVILTLSLSDYISTKDTIKGCLIPSGLYTKTGVPNNQYSSTVANNSTLDYPKAFGRWRWPGRQRFTTAQCTLRAIAYNYFARNKMPVSCVKFRIEDQHSNVDSVFVVHPTIQSNFGDTVKVYEYIGVLSNSKFTALDSLKCDFFAFPQIGDSVFATNDGKYPEITVNYSTQINLCDKSNTYGVTVACVDTVNGNNGTAACVDYGSFDKANPPNKYADVGAALNAIRTYNNTNHSRADHGAGIVYLYTDARFTVSTVTAATGKTWCTITHAPDTADFKFALTEFAGSNGIGGRLKIEGLTLKSAPAGGFFKANKMLWVHRDSINVPSGVLFYTDSVHYITHCKILRVAGGLRPNTANYHFALIRGNRFYGAADYLMTGHFTGNYIDGSVTGFYLVDTLATYTHRIKNVVYDCNKFMYMDLGTSTGLLSLRLNQSDSAGIAVVNNIFENYKYRASMNPILRIAYDGSVNDYLQNVLVWYNTVTGQRTNLFYNDNGTAPLYRVWCSVKNNIFENYNIKTDVFTTANAARVGNWGPYCGTGYSGNLMAEITGIGAPASFMNYYPGKSTIMNRVAQDADYVKFTSRKAYAGNSVDNTGRGDYTLQSSSPAVGLAVWQGVPSDVEGNNRRLTGGSSGAFEYGSDPEPPAPTPQAKSRDFAAFHPSFPAAFRRAFR